MKKRRRHTGRILAGIATGMVLLVCAGALAYEVHVKNEEEKEFLAQEKEKKALEERLAAVPLNNPQMPAAYRPLAADNPDVYAWLEIQDTPISYPIVQSEKVNGFYLNHDAAGKESETGAIFTENYNSKDFTDSVTVLYGNRMEDGSMLGSLLEYEDARYFQEHRRLTVYTAKDTLYYEIFAAYCNDDSHLLLKRDLNKKQNLEAYIRDIYQVRGLKNHVDKEKKVSAQDKFLAVSTGYPQDAGKRFVLQAVLESTETNE